jgi:hypothetical protein
VVFARWLFQVAGVYGLLVVLPMYLMEEQIGRDAPPPITHPEFFYGFVGVVTAWQVAFLVIGQDPVRYRWFMIPAVLEKFTFVAAAIVLFAQGRLSPMMFGAGMVDLVFGVLFLVAFWRLAPRGGVV